VSDSIRLDSESDILFPLSVVLLVTQDNNASAGSQGPKDQITQVESIIYELQVATSESFVRCFEREIAS
jgi:hypothetical protein